MWNWRGRKDSEVAWMFGHLSRWGEGRVVARERKRGRGKPWFPRRRSKRRRRSLNLQSYECCTPETDLRRQLLNKYSWACIGHYVVRHVGWWIFIVLKTWQNQLVLLWLGTNKQTEYKQTNKKNIIAWRRARTYVMWRRHASSKVVSWAWQTKMSAGECISYIFNVILLEGSRDMGGHVKY